MASRKGLWIALGLGGVVLLAGVAFIGAIVFVVVRHLEIRPASIASAAGEYDSLRARFAGQVPLIEIDPDNPGRVRVHRRSESSTQSTISTLHLFAWNPRDGKVVSLDLPIWLMRLQPRMSSFRWDWGEHFRLENLQVTVEDIERHGPGLIVNFEGHRGERLILWTE